MTGFIAFLQALPEFLKLMNRLGDLMNRFMAWSEQHGLNKWIDDLEASINNLEKADTPEKKLNAAHDLVGVIRNLR